MIGRIKRPVIDLRPGVAESLVFEAGSSRGDATAAVGLHLYTHKQLLGRVIDAFDLASIPAAKPVLDAYHELERWLTRRPRARATRRRPPAGSNRPRGNSRVRNPDGTINRAGYTSCVLDALRQRLRRRDIFLPGSARWGDPRAALLPTGNWLTRRDDLCDELGLDPQPNAVVDELAATLDAAGGTPPPGWRSTPTCASSTATAAMRSC